MTGPDTPMVTIPAGTFTRGSDASPDEQPVHTVAMSSFAIDADPVRNRDFAAFIAAGGYRTQPLWTPEGWEYIASRHIHEPTYWQDQVWGAPEMPLTGVSWWEALAYARFAGKTLPTEAQWEYAARGSDGRIYPWGEDEPDPGLANYAPDGDPIDRHPTVSEAHPRGDSPFGCRDMAGNFAEWCLDTYRPGYDVEAQVDPVWISDDPTAERIVRGGCGLHSEDYLRCAARDCYPPGIRDNLFGVRCVSPRSNGPES